MSSSLRSRASQAHNCNYARVLCKGIAGEVGLPGMPGGNGDQVSIQKKTCTFDFTYLLASACWFVFSLLPIHDDFFPFSLSYLPPVPGCSKSG